MTDKQIIIDGVDVSQCEFYKKGICDIWPDMNYIEPPYCKNEEDCHYRNWKRKEQECEELKEQVKKYGEINEQETKDYAELKAENDELKKIIERLDVPKHEVIDMDIALENEKLKVENEELKGIRDRNFLHALEEQKRADKLSKTLVEIKKIAENGKRFAERYMITGEQKANVLTYANAILQKISECEVE